MSNKQNASVESNKVESIGQQATSVVIAQLAMPWDKWTWEELTGKVLAATVPNLTVSQATAIQSRAGRALRGAFKGRKGTAFTALDHEYIVEIVAFELRFHNAHAATVMVETSTALVTA